MGQFVGCIRGIAEACKALDFPVVSGNVSLYNETNGRAILPTPTIGGVGLIDDFTKSATLAFKRAGEAILLIGETKGWLGQSMYLREICGREEGAPPPVDLDRGTRERRFRARADPRRRPPRAVHDLSDGGLLVALAEMAMASGIGAQASRGAGRYPRACLLVRRGSGALCRHRAGSAGGRVLARARGASVPVWRDRHDRRRHIDAAGRAPHPSRDSARAFRRLAAGLHGRRAVSDLMRSRPWRWMPAKSSG